MAVNAGKRRCPGIGKRLDETFLALASVERLLPSRNMGDACVTCGNKMLAGQIAALEIRGRHRRQTVILLAAIEQDKGDAKIIQSRGQIVRQADRRQDDRIDLMRHQILDNTVDLLERIVSKENHQMIAARIQILGKFLQRLGIERIVQIGHHNADRV